MQVGSGSWDAHLLFCLPAGRLKQAPPLAFGLTPGRRLDLAPPAASARPVGRIAALAHHAFEPAPLRHAEQHLAVIERFGMRQRRATEPAQGSSGARDGLPATTS